MTAVDETPAPGYFKPRRLGHVNLYISDYERSLRFYRDVVGLGDGWTRPSIGGAFLNNGATHHDIGFIPWNSPITRKPVLGPGLNHLGFEFESELLLVNGYARAREAGFEFAATVDHLIAHSVYSWDPDGYGIELYADTDLSWKDPDFLELRRASTNWKPDIVAASNMPHYIANSVPRAFEHAIFHTCKVTGVVLVTNRFDDAYRYYRTLIGLVPVQERDAAAFVCLGGSCGGRDVTLFRASRSLEAGFHHMNCQVLSEEDLRSSMVRATEAGVRIERTVDHPLRYGALVRDPDGSRVLFYIDRAPFQSRLAAVDPDEAIWLV